MSLSWPPIRSLAGGLADSATNVQYATAGEDAVAACRYAGDCLRQLQELAAELVLMAAYKGVSQRKIAELLGVPESTLRGAKAEAAAIAAELREPPGGPRARS